MFPFNPPCTTDGQCEDLFSYCERASYDSVNSTCQCEVSHTIDVVSGRCMSELSPIGIGHVTCNVIVLVLATFGIIMSFIVLVRGKLIAVVVHTHSGGDDTHTTTAAPMTPPSGGPVSESTSHTKHDILCHCRCLAKRQHHHHHHHHHDGVHLLPSIAVKRPMRPILVTTLLSLASQLSLVIICCGRIGEAVVPPLVNVDTNEKYSIGNFAALVGIVLLFFFISFTLLAIALHWLHAAQTSMNIAAPAFHRKTTWYSSRTSQVTMSVYFCVFFTLIVYSAVSLNFYVAVGTALVAIIAILVILAYSFVSITRFLRGALITMEPEPARRVRMRLAKISLMTVLLTFMLYTQFGLLCFFTLTNSNYDSLWSLDVFYLVGELCLIAVLTYIFDQVHQTSLLVWLSVPVMHAVFHSPRRGLAKFHPVVVAAAAYDDPLGMGNRENLNTKDNSNISLTNTVNTIDGMGVRTITDVNAPDLLSTMNPLFAPSSPQIGGVNASYGSSAASSPELLGAPRHHHQLQQHHTSSRSSPMASQRNNAGGVTQQQQQQPSPSPPPSVKPGGLTKMLLKGG